MLICSFKEFYERFAKTKIINNNLQDENEKVSHDNKNNINDTKDWSSLFSYAKIFKVWRLLGILYNWSYLGFFYNKWSEFEII